jgi:chromosome segregation ATPase
MGLLRKNYARRAAKADARVAALARESTELQLRRSQAEAAMAQFEAQRLRAELEALQARYAQLQHAGPETSGPPAQRRGRQLGPTGSVVES